MEQTITLIIAIIGLFGSIITICINNIYQKKTELRKIKENQYIDFLACLAKAKVAKNEDRYTYNLTLSAEVQSIYLVGNKEVQEALKGFLKVFGKDNQNELYTKLILAMKKDLYGDKKGSSSSDEISFTVFDD